MDSDRSILYEPLPLDVQPKVVPPYRDHEPMVKHFLSNILLNDEPDHIDATLRKALPLVNFRQYKRKLKSRRPHGALSLSERRRLGLYQLRRHGSQYADALPVHELWLQYITGLISISELEKNGFTGNFSDKQWAQVSLSLYRADYHGAKVEVTRTKCSSLRGIEGIVLMDTKNTFKIISRDNVIRTVPKAPCVFSFNIKGYKCTLYGKYFCTRPIERSVKKVKGNCPCDL